MTQRTIRVYFQQVFELADRNLRLAGVCFPLLESLRIRVCAQPCAKGL